MKVVRGARLQEIDQLISRHPAKQAKVLKELRAQIKQLMPGATERIFYQMPSFEVSGVILLSYDGFKEHSSIFPGPEVIKRLEKDLAKYQTSKGAIQFDAEKLPTVALLKKILKARIELINASYPKSSGEFMEFYDNGFLKAKGRYREGEMHGAWEFYRRDGSIMRSGKLSHGEPVGEWITYPRGARE
ncbi:MAG: hypothetical protein RI917_100 [Actinomycetota bacterium]|jgi:uncharacterized protein YdhG (YjbR/CyaY superfamily)